MCSSDLYLFVDEFTNFNDAEIGRTAVLLLERLGYEVKTIPHPISGRAYLSKGMLDEARVLAMQNVRLWSSLISENTPLVGIEPSAILTFRDEYPDLVSDEWVEKAQELAAEQSADGGSQIRNREIQFRVLRDEAFLGNGAPRRAAHRGQRRAVQRHCRIPES